MFARKPTNSFPPYKYDCIYNDATSIVPCSSKTEAAKEYLCDLSMCKEDIMNILLALIKSILLRQQIEIINTNDISLFEENWVNIVNNANELLIA